MFPQKLLMLKLVKGVIQTCKVSVIFLNPVADGFCEFHTLFTCSMGSEKFHIAKNCLKHVKYGYRYILI